MMKEVTLVSEGFRLPVVGSDGEVNWPVVPGLTSKYPINTTELV